MLCFLWLLFWKAIERLWVHVCGWGKATNGTGPYAFFFLCLSWKWPLLSLKGGQSSSPFSGRLSCGLMMTNVYSQTRESVMKGQGGWLRSDVPALRTLSAVVKPVKEGSDSSVRQYAAKEFLNKGRQKVWQWPLSVSISEVTVPFARSLWWWTCVWQCPILLGLLCSLHEIMPISHWAGNKGSAIVIICAVKRAILQRRFFRWSVDATRDQAATK